MKGAYGRLDQRLLVLITLSLVAFGLVMVYSATSASAAIGNADPMSYLKRQAVYALLGVVVMARHFRSSRSAFGVRARAATSRCRSARR